mmetsp:Transcript_10359/g.17370  ORF Transcript_10359/g.17370 Transcript_10359/m.17370 type:complete len:373 (-) Transcript_10359:550-1668(-)
MIYLFLIFLLILNCCEKTIAQTCSKDESTQGSCQEQVACDENTSKESVKGTTTCGGELICCVDLKPTMTDLTVRTSLTIDTNVHVGKSLSIENGARLIVKLRSALHTGPIIKVNELVQLAGTLVLDFNFLPLEDTPHQVKILQMEMFNGLIMGDFDAIEVRFLDEKHKCFGGTAKVLSKTAEMIVQYTITSSCTVESPSESDGPPLGLTIAIVIAAVLVLGLVALLVIRMKRQSAALSTRPSLNSGPPPFGGAPVPGQGVKNNSMLQPSDPTYGNLTISSAPTGVVGAGGEEQGFGYNKLPQESESGPGFPGIETGADPNLYGNVPLKPVDEPHEPKSFGVVASKSSTVPCPVCNTPYLNQADLDIHMKKRH